MTPPDSGWGMGLCRCGRQLTTSSIGCAQWPLCVEKPDSSERRAGKSHLHVGKECGPSCPDGNGIEFKPDSGERKATKITDHTFRPSLNGRDECCVWGIGRPMCRRPVRDHAEPDCAASDSGAHAVPICPACGVVLGTAIPAGLAQRILAALEQEARSGNVTAQRLEALASELRAAVERKP